MTYDLTRMNTRLPAETIQRMVQANPAKRSPGGNILLPPCRLSYPNLAKKGQATNEDGTPREGSYGGVFLFTPDADLTAARQERAAKMAEFFPKNPQGAGMRPVFRDQGERVAPDEGGANVKGQTTVGYVPGCVFLSANAPTNRPSISTLVNGLVTGFTGTIEEIESTFYPGCWVIPSVNVFHGKNAKNPGAFFGLQGVIKVMDDTQFGGGSINPNAEFQGIQIDAGANPADLFN